MAYWDMAQIAQDGDLTNRVQACAAQEITGANPYQWAADHMLLLAAQPGWDAAWASAVAAGNPRPGKDPAVITDGMILSATQLLAAGP